MFDIVLLFLEYVFPSIEDLLNEPQKKRKIGKEIFLLYENLCHIVVNGQEIELEIERALSFLKEKKGCGQVDRTYISHLGYKLNKQSIYLAKFFHVAIILIKDLDQSKKIPYTKLAPLYIGKFTVIEDLVYTLRGEYGNETKLITYNFNEILKYLDAHYNNNADISLFGLINQEEEIDFIKSVKIGAIVETNHIGQKDYDSLVFYLNHEDLDLKFDLLKQFTNYLKELLIVNFTLTEIILDVNDTICNEPGKWGPKGRS